MGFDLFIHMNLMMDDVTGKPFYYGINKETGKTEKLYELPVVEIPEELRQYLYGRGHHFHVYTDKFNRKDIYQVSVSAFLERFPSWHRYEESDYWEDDHEGWTRDDHKNFKKLLKFLEAQSIGYSVSWSY
jgi:hypothetical protein